MRLPSNETPGASPGWTSSARLAAYSWHSGAVKELDAPIVFFLPKNSGFQPAHILCLGCVLDGASVGIGNPRHAPIDVNLGFVYGPGIDFAGGMRLFHQLDQGVAGNPTPCLEGVKVRNDDGAKLRNILGCQGSKHGADDLSYLSLTVGNWG